MKNFIVAFGIFWLVFGGLIVSHNFVDEQKCRNIIKSGFVYSINGVINEMYAKCAEADEECLRPLSELDPNACKKINTQRLLQIRDDSSREWVESATELPQ